MLPDKISPQLISWGITVFIKKLRKCYFQIITFQKLVIVPYAGFISTVVISWISWILRDIFSLHFEIFEIGMYFTTTANLLMLSARLQSLTVCYCLCICNFGHRYDITLLLKLYLNKVRRLYLIRFKIQILCHKESMCQFNWQLFFSISGGIEGIFDSVIYYFSYNQLIFFILFFYEIDKEQQTYFVYNSQSHTHKLMKVSNA